MLQNPRKTLGFKKNMVYKIPPRGGGKPYPASGLHCVYLVPLKQFCLDYVSRSKVLRLSPSKCPSKNIFPIRYLKLFFVAD